MALAEICGIKDFDSHKKNNIYEDDWNKLCTNFNFAMQLAVPPFSNVSCYKLFVVYFNMNYVNVF